MESQEMMSLCLSKVRGLGKVKIVDTSFVWTEPHSKIIKLKLVVMKEIDKSNFQSSFIVEYKVEWTQCSDCAKTFTPHLWCASVQIRQKVPHKRTFLLLEQIVLKHNAHAKALNVEEQPDGVDFFFQNKSKANALIDFVGSMFPIKVKESKQLISHDMNSNLFNYKYSFMVEIAPVCIDDLIVLDKETSKALGGCGPVLLTYKVSSRIHLICPLTFRSYEFDENTYWRHNFKSYIDRTCLKEFLIMDVDEEIDYKKLYKKGNETQMTIDSVPTSKGGNNSKSTNYKNVHEHNKSSFGIQKKDLKYVTVQCILNNQVKDGNADILSIRTHLGEKIRPGDIYYGYDLTALIMNHDLENICAVSKIPDYVLVKKKFKRKNNKKRIWKLRHLTKPEDPLVFRRKNEDEKEKQYEEFLRDIEENKEMRKNINIYKVNYLFKILKF
jgi:nonsense-mediated mRNA decay protein 3